MPSSGKRTLSGCVMSMFWPPALRRTGAGDFATLRAALPGWRAGVVDRPGAARGIPARRARRQLEGALDVDRDFPRHVGRIPQRQNSFPGRPRRPAVRLQPQRVPAHPMRIDQCVGVGPRPPRALCDRIPVFLREQRWRDVHLLQLRAGTKVRSDFRRKIVTRIGHQVVR